MPAPRFGIYFFPWYNETRWSHHRRRHTPIKGEYDSADSRIVDWQSREIAACGFDYVVIESVLPGDWGYDFMVEATDRFVEGLIRRGVKWSFMIDLFVTPDPERHVEMVCSEIERYASRGWLDGLAPSGTWRERGLMFTFGSSPRTAARLNAVFGGCFHFAHIAWFRHWGSPAEEDDVPVFHPFNKFVRVSAGTTYRSALGPLGFAPFWQLTPDIIEMNGFATACPGYDDSLLRRDPQLAPVMSRAGGETFRAQLEAATNSGAGDVLIYGWNEYFEAAAIEPTVEFGRKYVNLAADFIATARAGS